jgi:hypothetical protein
MALALAIHTARISSRISQNNALLAQYLSNKSSIPISSMMAILLRAAGDLVFLCSPNLLLIHIQFSSMRHPRCAKAKFGTANRLP